MGDAARILVVCTGNICRSPFVERLLRHRLAERRSPEAWPVEVSSAGTGALAGHGIEDRVAAALVELGGDPSGFRARQLTADLVDGADLVLTATRAHRSEVGRLSPGARRRVFTLLDFADLLGRAETLEAGPPPTDARAWVERVAEAAAAGRGLTPPLSRAQADIVDPFGRADAVVARMAEQVLGAMPAVVRAVAGEG